MRCRFKGVFIFSNFQFQKNIFCFFSLFFSLCFSQQLPLSNQYIYNPLVINPAFSGTSSAPFFSVSTRSQWVGFSEGITTSIFSTNYPLSESQGVGGVIFQDNTGAISITGIEIDYSFKFPAFLDYNISLGLGLVPYQYLYDANMVVGNSYDPILDLSQKKTSFDTNFGVLIYNDFLFGSFSVLNMIESSVVESLDSDNPNQLMRHYFALIGYNYFNTKSNIGFEQTFLMRNTRYSNVQFDFNLKTNFNDVFWLMCGYRTNKELLAGIGVKYGRMLFMYTVDFNQGDIGLYSNSSHEFGLVFSLGKKNVTIDWKKDINLLD